MSRPDVHQATAASRSDEPAGDSPDDPPHDDRVMDEILAALEMPPAGLRRWFGQLHRFCHRHGGERHYGPLLAVIDRYRQRLE